MTRLPAAALVLLVLLLLAASPPNDPLVGQQGHLAQVGAFQAWDVGRGNAVVVAVLDTGVDLDHPDLVERLAPGIDLVEPGTPPDDPQGHGTQVAGLVAATAGNATGVAGVAPAARIMPIRVLDAAGVGTSDVVADGIRWAVTNGADVINLSLAEVVTGGGGSQLGELIDPRVEEEIRAAADAGVVVVAAAGNDGGSQIPYSAAAPLLVVGAVDATDRRWPQSNVDERTLFAPGTDMLSTWHQGRYARADGTSFATPVVSGGAAILLGAGVPATAVRDRLANSARPIGFGRGRLDLVAATAGLPRLPAPPAPVTPQPTAHASPSPSPSPTATPTPVPTPTPTVTLPPPGPGPVATGPVEVQVPPGAGDQLASGAGPRVAAAVPTMSKVPPDRDVVLLAVGGAAAALVLLGAVAAVALLGRR